MRILYIYRENRHGVEQPVGFICNWELTTEVFYGNPEYNCNAEYQPPELLSIASTKETH